MEIKLVYIFVFLLGLIKVNSVKLKCTDNKKCAYWKKNGFCSDSIYDEYTKVSLCPTTCGFCKKKNTNNNNGGKKNVTDTEKPYELFKNSLDEKKDPCDDFFAFSCGKFQSDHKESKTTVSRTGQVSETIMKLVTEIIFDVNATTTVPAIQKMYDYRNACLNLTRIEQGNRTQELLIHIDDLGKMPMLTPVWPVNGVPFDLDNILQKIGQYQISNEEIFIGSQVFKSSNGTYEVIFYPASLMMKDLRGYLRPEMAQKKQALTDFLVEIMSYIAFDVNSNRDFDTIKTAVEEVIKFETKLAEIMVDAPPLSTDLRENEKKFQKTTIGYMNQLVQSIDFEDLIANSDMFPSEVKSRLTPEMEVYYFTDGLFRRIDKALQDADDQVLADYIILRLILQSVPYLDTRFSQAGNKFGKAIDGVDYTSTRTQDCFDIIDRHFGMVVDHLFAEKHFPFETRTKVDQLIENIRQGMRDMINADEWLSDTTRQAAINKLEKMRKHIGTLPYAENVPNLNEYYSTLTLSPGDSYRQMGIKINRHLRFRSLMNLIVPGYDQLSNSKLRATVTNAFNLPALNTVYIPVGITYLANFSQPMSTVYGALGFIMGHEFSHGFDSSGAEYNQDGNAEDWWDATTKSEFKTRTKCMEDQYSEIEIPMTDGLKINGTLTLAENIADNAGIKAAFKAYKLYLASNKDPHVQGYKKYSNEQMFFISAAVSFCDMTLADRRKQLQKIDDHSPNFARMNVVYGNFPEFAKAFKCKKGKKMTNPDNKCEVW